MATNTKKTASATSTTKKTTEVKTVCTRKRASKEANGSYASPNGTFSKANGNE